ncbi:hypothetical protein GDO86_003607 [Hymenochirus boettgeri]|uniref:Uncharacterized protein n=1 Tax=Hymenochirus boettgeri TaxID=247094 RepID=A0A8T2K1R2_9PIPI|nr:hypothetical protein GDO86_003607 [Hymenochirus boettgeri]
MLNFIENLLDCLNLAYTSFRLYSIAALIFLLSLIIIRTIFKIVILIYEYSVNARSLHFFPEPPRRNWFLGHSGMFLPTEEGLMEVSKLVANLSKCNLIWLGPPHSTSQRSSLSMTQNRDFSSATAPKDELFYVFFRPWLGDGLLLSQGKKWMKHRRLLTPAFHFDILKNYVKIFNQSTEIMHAKWRRLAAEGPVCLDMFEHVSLMTLDTLLKCIFSYDSNCQEKSSDYIAVIYELSSLLMKREHCLPHHIDFIYHLSSNGRLFR